MNLDEELTTTFDQEADLRRVPLPNVADLIRGGRRRRRRRNVARIGVATTVAVLVGGVTYGVTQTDHRGAGTVDVPPATSASDAPEPLPQRLPDRGRDRDREPVEPGTYRMFVGVDPAGANIEADLTFTGPNWVSGDTQLVSDGETTAGVGLYQPVALAGDRPCSDDWLGREAARTPKALARQLVRLPRSTVIQPLTSTEAFGHDAVHLRLRISANCPVPGWYQVAEAPGISRGISYGDATRRVLIDFWVVDLDGTAVVVDMWHKDGASADLVGRIAQVRDSITFVISD